MKINEAFPTKYLSAEADIPDGGDLIVTISDCQMEQLGQGDKIDTKPVLYFSDHDKGLALNKTNANTIAGVLGSQDTDDWIGQKIALFAQEVDFKGQQVLAIRVRMRKPRAAQQQPVAAAAGRRAASEERDPFGDDE